ncbi:MAG: tetratricopeptide repeat protein, partial [Calditrichaeota bacterium]|nr:tetratricopeptide repeat protein [Calditrichota bacterium]MCB0314040.1 tetratricopeptide repeat protein [Calditrichota bacterium]
MKDYFISYCWDDEKIVRPLAEQLIQNGISVWIDHREVNTNDSIPEEISAALQTSHTVLLMWSAKSLIARWTRDELNASISLRKRIIPCLLDDTPLPNTLKTAQSLYIDLRNLDQETATRRLLDVVKKPFRQRSETSPRIADIPFRKNPNFTGREAQLQAIARKLSKTDGARAVVAGLGGVGKTELAIEYAYRHASEYERIWWLRSEGMVTLSLDFANLAHELNLPEKDDPDIEIVNQAVIRWLGNNRHWLLIFDNAQELEHVRKYLPKAAKGHIIITSRNFDWGAVADLIDLQEWDRSESIHFLLKRTGRQDAAGADELADMLGDLPLALEQACAYVDTRNIDFTEYKRRFQEERKAILKYGERTRYSDTVAITWEMAFREINNISKVPLLMLNLCAFLAPDPIPLVDLLNEAPNVPRALTAAFANKADFDKMLAPLSHYSLIRIEDDHLIVHRLIQSVTQDRMSKKMQKRIAEAAVTLVADVFPSEAPEEVTQWPRCQSWLSHADATISHAEHHHIRTVQMSYLCNQMGLYLQSRAAYPKAEPLFRRALALNETLLGTEDLYVAANLNNLAELLTDQGKYGEAEPLYRRALEISEAQLGAEHPDVATSLNNLGALLHDQGKYGEAESLYRRALEIREAQLGDEHLDVAQSINNLAELQADQGKYREAEPLFRQALQIYEAQLGDDNPNVATSLNNLASLLQAQGKYNEAELLFRRALEIRDTQLGAEHPDVATS